MRILLVPLLGITLVSSLTVAFLHAAAQESPPPKTEPFPIPENLSIDGFSAWDDSRKELISEMYDKQDRFGSVIRVYNVVSRESRFIHVSQQFPDSRYINLEAVASAPQGFVLLACEIGPGSRPYVGDHLLLYDDHSALVRDFVAADYSITAVAADSRGNIYALGAHDSEFSSQESYPLIQKYDSFGHVVSEMLPRSLFPTEDDPTEDGHQHNGHSTGTPLLTATEDGVRVYLPKIGEMLVVQDNGEIQARINAVAKLSEFTHSHGYAAFSVDGNAFSPSGRLWLAGRLENPLTKAEASPHARDFLVRIAAEGQLESPYEQALADSPPNYWRQLIAVELASK